MDGIDIDNYLKNGEGANSRYSISNSCCDLGTGPYVALFVPGGPEGERNVAGGFPILFWKGNWCTAVVCNGLAIETKHASVMNSAMNRIIPKVSLSNLRLERRYVTRQARTNDVGAMRWVRLSRGNAGHI